jgi:hypothetical protein
MSIAVGRAWYPPGSSDVDDRTGVPNPRRAATPLPEPPERCPAEATMAAPHR